MKSLLAIAALALPLTAGAAFAADLPSMAPAPAPAPYVAPLPIFTWTGFYLGGNIGGAWSNTGRITELAPVTATDTVYNGTGDLSSLRSRSTVIGGVQGGYNYQMGALVAGIEGDFDFLSYRSAAPATTPGGVVVAGGDTIGSRKANYLASIRGRLGVTPFDRALLYVTGGVAFSDLRYGVLDVCNTGACGPGLESGSKSVNTGYTLGGGIEYALTSNWIIRAEYLYYHFGGGNFRDLETAPVAGLTVRYNATSTNFNVARIGVEYKF